MLLLPVMFAGCDAGRGEVADLNAKYSAWLSDYYTGNISIAESSTVRFIKYLSGRKFSGMKLRDSYAETAMQCLFLLYIQSGRYDDALHVVDSVRYEGRDCDCSDFVDVFSKEGMSVPIWMNVQLLGEHCDKFKHWNTR